MLVPESFFQQPILKLSKELLGTFLVHESPEGRTVGRIVETEAYLSKGDPACHAARGKTKRNAAMFGRAGISYVYLIYGMYHCFNIVTGKVDRAEAVLIRALEPIHGIELMEARRGTDKLRNLCSGPGKLVQAMGITRDHNTVCLRDSSLQLHTRESFKSIAQPLSSSAVLRTTRIGIAKGKGDELPLRFYLKHSEFISKR